MLEIRQWLARPHGIQARFFLTQALFVATFMTMLGVALFINQRQSMEKRLTQDTQALTQLLFDKGNASSGFLARIAPQGILSYDYLLLEGYVEELSSDSDVLYVVIFNPAGAPLTHFLKLGEPYFQQFGKSAKQSDFLSVLTKARNDPGLLVVRRPIEYEGLNLGVVEIALSRTRITHRAQELSRNLEIEIRRIAVITASLIVISLIVLLLLIEGIFRRTVVSPIQSLMSWMSRLQGGDLNARAPILHKDEIGLLAQSFNHMADELQSQLNKIEEQRCKFKETRDYLANILDNSADMMATTGLDGRMVEFNSAAERTLGFGRAEVIGKPSSMIYQDCAELDRLYGVVYQGQPVQNAETRLTCKNGRIIDVEVTLSPLRDNAGMLIGAICIGRDVTLSKALRNELIQSEKMASIGQVASWITHQIRNYLGRILMNAAILQPQTSEGNVYKAHQDMLVAINEMDRMVTDLLDYSRTLKLHFAALNLNASLASLLEPINNEISGKITVEHDFAPDLPPIYADVFKLEQALNNVLKNAVEAMADGGNLCVSTAVASKEGCIKVEIQDTGEGIASEDIQSVLRPFFTTKQKGTGLGMAMASRIVEAHGGEVQLKSQVGVGTSIIFILPISRRKNRNE